ncbi:MAG: DUF4381 domain-containing protein [Polaromonas sp.]
MTAPSLDALRDIHLPPVPVLVTALSRWWLAAAALALVAALVWYLRRWLRRRPLRSALHELTDLATGHARDADTTRLASGLSMLVRRYAMARFAQAGMAGVTGSVWLAFLDAHGGEGSFANGIGAALESRPYQASGAFDEAALIALVRRWLKANPP